MVGGTGRIGRPRCRLARCRRKAVGRVVGDGQQRWRALGTVPGQRQEPLSIGRRSLRAGVQLLVPEPEISLQTTLGLLLIWSHGRVPEAVRTAAVRGGVAEPQSGAGSRAGGCGHHDGRCEGHRTPGRAGDGGPRRTRPVAHRPDPGRARRSRHLGIRVRRHRRPDGRRAGARRRVRPASPANRRGHPRRLARTGCSASTPGCTSSSSPIAV